MMKLSIIIPYYNADKWICIMLDSLLCQDLPSEEYEIIVVDDGSKENPKNLKEYVAKYANIRYLRQENSGPGGARNTGIKSAQGEYLFFCDSDDYISKNVLGSLYEIANSRNADMLFHQIREVAENDCLQTIYTDNKQERVFNSGKKYLAYLYGKKIRTGPYGYIIKKAFIERASLRFPDLIVTEDSCFFVDAIMSANTVVLIDAEVYFYVQHPQSLLHYDGRIQKTEKYADNILHFIEKINAILCEKTFPEDVPLNFRKSLEWLRNRKAFVMLIVMCHYLPHHRFCYYLDKLLLINSFPRPEGRHVFFKRFFLNPFCMKLINRYYLFKKRCSLR